MTPQQFQVDGQVSIPIAPPKDPVATRRRTTRSMVSHALKQMPNPDPILKKLGKDIQAYRDICVDGHVSSCIQSRKSGVLSLEWEIAANNASQEVVDLIKEMFTEMDLHKVLSEMLDAPLFGYSLHEIEWKLKQGRWIVSDVQAKPQEWFKFDENNKPLFISAENRDGDLLPEYKFLLLQHQASYVNPYGEALLSRCFWPASFKNQMIKFGLQFAEKYGQPFLFGKYDPDLADNATIDTLHQALIDLYQAGIATMPNTTEASLLEAGRSSSVDTFMRFIVFFNAEISKAILSQTLTTEQGDTGSYAMSQTHLMVRRDVVDSDKRLVEKALNQLIRWVVDFNFQDAIAPIFRLYEETDVDANLATRDKTLFDMGFRPNKDYFSKAYGIPDNSFDVVDPTAPATPAAEPAPAPAFTRSSVPSLPRAFVTPGAVQTSGARQLSAQVASSASPDPEEANAAMEMMLKPVIEMVTEGRSFESINEKLVEIFPEMDDEGLIEQLANATFLADLAGRLST